MPFYKKCFHMFHSALIVTLCIPLVFCAFPADRIKKLPGLQFQPTFKQYSGYLQATGTKKLHYWFVQSKSDRPQDDPVVLWMNGGPGCSSMEGLLSEHGPFKVNDKALLVENPQTWNSIANMIYLEAPAGVGFSYSDDKKYATNDDQVSKDNYLALKDFFNKFPEYKKNDFYVTGESYGGIYVPTLSDRILNDPKINFKGFAVGNGLSDATMNTNSAIYFAYYHGLIGKVRWSQLLSHCCDYNETSCDFVSSKDKICGNLLNDIISEVWLGGFNVYNLYKECFGGVGSQASRNNLLYMSALLPINSSISLNKNNDLEETPNCVNSTAMTTYLNRPDVRLALHIPSTVQKWEVCSTAVGVGYTRLYNTTKKFYNAALKKGKRIMVYNGDVDMACNFLGDEWFVDSLQQPVVKERKIWYYKAADGTKQIAGFAKQYKNLIFVTVKGSGHMVPQDKPIPALVLFQNFILNKPF